MNQLLYDLIYHANIRNFKQHGNEEIALRFIEIVEYRLHQVSLQPQIGLSSVRDKKNLVKSILHGIFVAQ
jgi:hypothetical protein